MYPVSSHTSFEISVLVSLKQDTYDVTEGMGYVKITVVADGALDETSFSVNLHTVAGSATSGYTYGSHAQLYR